MNKQQILKFLKKHRKELRDKFGVTKLGLFGSYARDEENPNSDIDIAVEIDATNKFRAFFSLRYFLEESLQKKIDLGIEQTLKPIAKEKILKEIIYVE